MAQPIALVISRQVASGGEPIGRLLAQRLGCVFLNREILGRTAHHLQDHPEAAPEGQIRPTGFWRNLFAMFAVNSQPTTGGNLPVPPEGSARDLWETRARVIREVAGRRDLVLVGQAGYAILADHPGLASVFIMAPREQRVLTLLTGVGLASQAEARAVLDTMDRQRREFVEGLTGRSWSEASNFHLCLDTGRLDQTTAVEMILTLVRKTREALPG